MKKTSIAFAVAATLLAPAAPAFADKWETYETSVTADVPALEDGSGTPDAWGINSVPCESEVGAQLCDIGPEQSIHHEVVVADTTVVVVDAETGTETHTAPNYKPERDDVCEPAIEDVMCIGRLTPED